MVNITFFIHYFATIHYTIIPLHSIIILRQIKAFKNLQNYPYLLIFKMIELIFAISFKHSMYAFYSLNYTIFLNKIAPISK